MGPAHSWFSLADIFTVIADRSQKKYISSLLKDALDKKLNSSQYYVAAMFDMIEPQEDFTELYFKDVEKIVLKRPSNLFNKRDYYFESRIDNCINFCFKYNLLVPAFITDNLRALGIYYTWLLGMEQFDYRDFNPAWLNNHFTVYFKRHFRKSTALKKHLLGLIKADPENNLSRTFVLIYNFED